MGSLAALKICRISFTPDPAGGWIQALFNRTSGAGNNYQYVDTTSVIDYTVQAGDVLEYDVWLPTGSVLSGNGCMDIGFSDATYLGFSPGPSISTASDQNGQAINTGNLTAYANNAWYHRIIAFPSGTVGKLITKYDLVDEADVNAGAVSHYAYYRDIQITDGAGQVRKAIWFQTNTLPTFANDFITPPGCTFVGSKSYATPIWTDVSPYLREPYNVRRGRQTELDTVEAGTHTVTLDNRDGRFTPQWASSPYYPNVVPIRKISEESLYPPNLNVTDSSFEIGVGSWTAVGAGTTIAQTAVRAWDGTKSLQISHPAGVVNTGAVSSILPLYKLPAMMGFIASIYAYAPAGVTLTFRVDWYIGAAYSFSSTAGTGAPGGSAWLRINTPVVGSSLGATVDGFALYVFKAASDVGVVTTQVDAAQMEPIAKNATVPSAYMGTGVKYSVYRGLIERWPPESNWSDATVTITCSDAFEPFNKNKISTFLAQATTDARFNTLMDAMGWPVADRSVETGQSSIQSVTPSDGTILSLLQDLARTENGNIFIGPDGVANFQNRHHRLLTNNTSLATFGDATGEIPYEKVVPSYDKDRIYNDVAVQRTGGAEQHAIDYPSQSKYWPRTYGPVTLSVLTEAEALNFAQWLLRRTKQPSIRFDSIKLVALNSDDPINVSVFKQILARELGDRVTVIRRPPGGLTIQQDCHIEAIQHDVSTGSWETTWTLSPADTASYWVMDSATLSVLDSTTSLAY